MSRIVKITIVLITVAILIIIAILYMKGNIRVETEQVIQKDLFVRIPFDTEEHDMDYFNTIGGESGIDVYKDDEFFVKYDEELKEDNLGILGSVGINCVAIDINRIAEKYKFSNVEIKVNPENREQQVIDFIVAFDTYDYYTISYWYNIGCIAIHDDSGIYAQMFQENEDEEREKDRRQHEEN